MLDEQAIRIALAKYGFYMKNDEDRLYIENSDGELVCDAPSLIRAYSLLTQLNLNEASAIN